MRECEESGNDREKRLEKEFDLFIKQGIIDASNEYRKEHGLPELTEEEIKETMESPPPDWGGEPPQIPPEDRALIKKIIRDFKQGGDGAQNQRQQAPGQA